MSLIVVVYLPKPSYDFTEDEHLIYIHTAPSIERKRHGLHGDGGIGYRKLSYAQHPANRKKNLCTQERLASF